MRDDRLGGRPRTEIKARLHERSGGGDGIPTPGPDWTPGVSIYPVELQFEETRACETSESRVIVFNTDARETLAISSITTDDLSFQPRPIAEEPDVVEPGGSATFEVTFAPRGAGAVEGTLLVNTDKGSFLIKGRGVATESPYGLQPLADVRVPPRFPHVFALEVHNPHDTPLRIVEAVSSDQFVQLAAAPDAAVDADADFFHPRFGTAEAGGSRRASGGGVTFRGDASARGPGVYERRASTASGGGGSPFRESEALRGERLNASTLFAPTMDTSGVLSADDDDTFDAAWSDDARVVLAFANQKLAEEYKRYRAFVAGLPPLPRRSAETWTIPPGETRTVLLARLALNRVGRFEGSIRLTMRHGSERTARPTGARGEKTAALRDVSDDEETATKTVRARVPVSAACASGVTVSPSRLDFGVATRRSDRLRATLSLFNGAPKPARVTQIETRPNDPSLRARLENGFADGVLPAFGAAPDAIALTYSGKLEGFRVGTLVVRVDVDDAPLEVAYRARVVHGKLEVDVDEAGFASPDAGRAPFETQRKTLSATNAFPVPLAVTGARVVVDDDASSDASRDDRDDAASCCLRVVSSSFDATQVVRPGDVVRSLEIEYKPRAAAALFDARLELTTNLTTLSVPLRVYHGQLACFDAAQAAARAAAAAAAAAAATSTVTPAGGARRPGEDAPGPPGARDAGTALGETNDSRAAFLAVPCAVSDGKYREREGLSIMGVIDFGVTRVGDEKVRRIAVRNPNPVAIALESVTSTVRAARVTRVEVSAAPLSAPISPSSVSALQSEAATRGMAPFRLDPPAEGCLTERGKMAACVQSFARRAGSAGRGAARGDVSDARLGERANATFASATEPEPEGLDARVASGHRSVVVIPPDHVATIDVLAAPKEEEMARMGGMLSFALHNGRTLVAPVVLRALRGEVAVVADGRGSVLRAPAPRVADDALGAPDAPALAVLEVPAAFPGRSTRAALTLRSSFAEAVTVFGFASSDPAVRLELSAEKLKPGKRIVVGEVVFDPVDLDADRAYTGLARNRRTGATAYKAGAAARASGGAPRAGGGGVSASSFGRDAGTRPGAKGAWRGSVRSFFGFGDGGARRWARGRSANAARAAPALSSADVEEIARARDAWARVAGGENPHAASSAAVESVLTVRTDAVDEVRVRVRTKLVRPKMLLFSGDDDDEFAELDVEAFVDDDEDEAARDGDEREAADGTRAEGEAPSNSPRLRIPRAPDSGASSASPARTARSARVVDFGSAQVGAKTRRRRVVFINPFADQSLCVRVLPMVPAATSVRGRDVRVAGGRGALDDILEAAEAHFLGEYPGGFGGFSLEGGELNSARESHLGGADAASAAARGSDWACLAPFSKIDLGALVFAPREVRPYAAHLCVRNNFTTLECATLRGDGDAVKVSVSKTKRTKKQFEAIAAGRNARASRAARTFASPPAVTDVAFRLPRASSSEGGGRSEAATDGDFASSVDVMTRAIWVVNDGSAVARVSKPWIGALECGGDGSVEGYTVSPCGAFELPPGASKRLTVVCHPERARRAAPTPDTRTRLAMDVKSADGESSRLVVQLSAATHVAGGAYAAGELEKARAFGGERFAWRRVVGTAAALCVAAFGATRAGALPSRASCVASPAAAADEAPGEASARRAWKTRRGSDDDGADAEERTKETETETPARRRRERALRGDVDAAAPLSVSALGTGDGAARSRALAPARMGSADSVTSDSVTPATRARLEENADETASEASRSATPSSPPPAGAAERLAPPRVEASPPRSPAPSPEAGRRHTKETKPQTLTLSSIPKPKTMTGGAAGSVGGGAFASPAAAAPVVEPRRARPLDAKRSTRSVREGAAVTGSVARAHAPSTAPTAAATRSRTALSHAHGVPRSRPAPPAPAGSAAASARPERDGFGRPPSASAGAFVPPPPPPPRRAADGGWLAPPLPPRQPPPSNQPSRGSGGAGVAREGVALPRAAGGGASFAEGAAPRASAAPASDARPGENRGGGWMPSPPSLGLGGPAFAPAPSVRAFGGGLGGLNLLSGGALGYNMWGAPAPPPGGGAGGFAGSFFDGGGDDALERPAGSRSPSADPTLGRARARTQEILDLDAEMEWSKHNKGLLDDLGLD